MQTFLFLFSFHNIFQFSNYAYSPIFYISFFSRIILLYHFTFLPTFSKPLFIHIFILPSFLACYFVYHFFFPHPILISFVTNILLFSLHFYFFFFLLYKFCFQFSKPFKMAVNCDCARS